MEELNVKALFELIREQTFRWNKAKKNGMMVAQETERLKNLVLNNMDDIVTTMRMAVEASDRIKMLEAEVESADAELNELDDEIKNLRNAAASNAAAKGKGKSKALPNG